jgi:hypothetical protein
MLMQITAVPHMFSMPLLMVTEGGGCGKSQLAQLFLTLCVLTILPITEHCFPY